MLPLPHQSIVIMRILVVDDEQDICEILQYNLENEGYEVMTANSAEEALMMPLEGFDLVLLDVMLGEMSGFCIRNDSNSNSSFVRASGSPSMVARFDSRLSCSVS